MYTVCTYDFLMCYFHKKFETAYILYLAMVKMLHLNFSFQNN